MPCFYCGKRVSLVRQMNDPDFCCDEHRARYHDLTRLALGRLLETREQLAPAAPKRRSRSKSAETAHKHRPAHPAPAAEPEIAEVRPEPPAEYTAEDSPVVSAPDGAWQQPAWQAPVAMPEVPPEEADLDPTLVAFVWNNPLGAPDDRRPGCEPATGAFVMLPIGGAFPRSGDPAAGGSFPTGSFMPSPPQNRFEHRVEFRATALPFERALPAVLPISSAAVIRVPGQAGPAPELRPDPLPPTRAYVSAVAAFPPPAAACPAAATRGPVFTAQAVFHKAEPLQAIAPAGANARIAPELRIALEPALPQPEINPRLRAALPAETDLRCIWTAEAVRPAPARTNGALEPIPIAPAALSLPAPAAPMFAPASVEPAEFVPPSAVIKPKAPAPARRRPDAALGHSAGQAPEIPALGASPTVSVLSAAPGLPWMAQPRKHAQAARPLPAPAATEVSGPAWPTVAIARVAVPPPSGAASSWVAQPLRDQRTSEKKPAATAFGAVVPGVPKATSAGPAGREIAAIGLLPMTARPGVQQGTPARLRFYAAPEIAGPEPGMPYLSAPPALGALSGYDIAQVNVARPADVHAAYKTELQPVPVRLTAWLTLPAAAARGVHCRGLDGPLRFVPPAALVPQNVKPAPAITPAELPAAFPMSPESAPVALSCKLGRTLAIPYSIPAAGQRGQSAAAGFVEAPLAPALPGAGALAGVPRLAGSEALPQVAAPARVISKAAACGWEAASVAMRLPLAVVGQAVPPASLQASTVFGQAKPPAPQECVRATQLRAEPFTAFAQPKTLEPQSANFIPGLTSAVLWKIGQPAPESRRAAAVPHLVPPQPLRKANWRTLIPRMRSAVARAHMPAGIFRPVDVPDFDDDNTVRIGAGYPAQGPGPAIPAFRFGPECADRPRPAAFVEALITPAAGRAVCPWAGAPFLPRDVILPRPATPLIEFDFYAIAAAPRERGWAFVSSVFRVVLFSMALPQATHPPGAQPPAAGFEELNTPAVERVVSDRAAAVWISQRG